MDMDKACTVQGGKSYCVLPLFLILISLLFEPILPAFSGTGGGHTRI